MNGGANTKSLRDPAQSETPRTSGNVMHENRETWSASAAQSGGRPVGEGQGQKTHRYPSLQALRGWLPSLVRTLHRYYTRVQLLARVSPSVFINLWPLPRYIVSVQDINIIRN